MRGGAVSWSRLDRSAHHLHAILSQSPFVVHLHTAIQRRLTAHRDQDTYYSLLAPEDKTWEVGGMLEGVLSMVLFLYYKMCEEL